MDVSLLGPFAATSRRFAASFGEQVQGALARSLYQIGLTRLQQFHTAQDYPGLPAGAPGSGSDGIYGYSECAGRIIAFVRVEWNMPQMQRPAAVCCTL
jgi:hypothetical protein